MIWSGSCRWLGDQALNAYVLLPLRDPPCHPLAPHRQPVPRGFTCPPACQTHVLLQLLQGWPLCPPKQSHTLVNCVHPRPSTHAPPLPLGVMGSPFPSSEPTASDCSASRAVPSSVDRHSDGVYRIAMEHTQPHRRPKCPGNGAPCPFLPRTQQQHLQMLSRGLIAIRLGPCLLQEALSLRPPSAGAP